MINSLKDVCPQGHEYTPENTLVRPQNQRQGMRRECRRCIALRQEQRAAAGELGRLDVVDGMKVCSRCEIDLPIRSFNRDKRYRSGYFTWCRSCVRAYRDENRGRILAVERRSHYGISVEDQLALLAGHDGRCDACGDEAKLQLDHDHETGKVRGFLCGPCNRALGQAHDNVDRLLALVLYLEGGFPRYNRGSR